VENVVLGKRVNIGAFVISRVQEPPQPAGPTVSALLLLYTLHILTPKVGVLHVCQGHPGADVVILEDSEDGVEALEADSITHKADTRPLTGGHVSTR
jgi:hypothetical protein